MTLKRTWPAPRVGHIVFCFFPHEETPDEPGPKPRPAIVMAVQNPPGAACKVEVCYGTGQRGMRELAATAFAITPEHSAAYRESGLVEPTIFDFRRTVVLPYDDRYFCVPSTSNSRSTSPYLGAVSKAQYGARLVAAVRAAGKEHLLGKRVTPPAEVAK